MYCLRGGFLMFSILIFIVGAFIGLFIGLGLGMAYDKRTSREIIETNVLKYIKSDELVAFERLYFLLELGPKDITILVMVLDKLIEEKTIKRYTKQGFHSLYKRNVNVLA